jgi:hypothetical protein
MKSFHRSPDLQRVELVALTAEVERRGYRLISAESMASIDRMTDIVPIDPETLALIRDGLRSVPLLCAELQEKYAEILELRNQLGQTYVMRWWVEQGELDKRLGAMALA